MNVVFSFLANKNKILLCVVLAFIFAVGTYTSWLESPTSIENSEKMDVNKRELVPASNPFGEPYTGDGTSTDSR